MNIDTLKERAKKIEIDKRILREKEEGRLRFIQKFPKENIPNMSLEEYCLGNGEDTFCCWIEFKGILFGSKGGSSSKHGLFRSNSDGCYYTGHGKKKRKIEGAELQEYFKKLKEIIVRALKLAEQDKIEEIIKLDFPMWDMLMLKILLIYFPDKFASVGASKVILECAKDLNLSGCELHRDNLILINHLLRLKFNNEINNAWGYEEIGTFIWENYKYLLDKDDVNYWIIAPAEKARLWEDCKRKSIIRVGWDEINQNLEGLSENDIKTLYFNSNQTGTNADAAQLIDFCCHVKPGDIIFAKRGLSEIVGVGKVISGLKYDDALSEYRHYRNVEWEKIGNWQLLKDMKRLPLKTITKANNRRDELLELTSPTPPTLTFPLNTILYGPPGTGKTYNTINYAIAIAENKPLKEVEKESKQNRKRVLNRFNELRKKGEVVFSTFHQSMSYEDFVEGIKPEPTENGGISYSVQQGIFANICDQAKTNWENSMLDESASFEDIWSAFTHPLFDGSKEYIEIPTARGSYKIYDISLGGTIHFEKQNGSKLHSLSLKTLKRLFIDRDALNKMGGLAMYYTQLINALDKVKIDAKPKETLKPFILVIDEINRGNVSAILGELITLLEDDKRLGAENELRVTLPYSKDDDFGVPPNLYIVGTMNTADRSVEALDTALRRRFTFEEMMPQPSLLIEHNNIDGIDLPRMLSTINSRLELLVGRDHTIGHAFFMRLTSIEELISVFQNKVIPQLQEYFYGDWSKINLILGDNFVSIKEQNQNDIWPKNSSADKYDFEVREIWEVTNPSIWTVEVFQSIYSNISE